MPLVPSIEDPKRKDELKRAKEDPQSFGPCTIAPKPKDWKPNVLKADLEREAAEEAAKTEENK